MRAWSLSCVLALGCSAPAAAPPPVSPVLSASGEALGTTWNVTWLAGDHGVDEAAATRLVTEALAEVDLHMSTWRDDSELSKARRSSGPVVVSDDTAFVVDAALDLARVSGGAFDPTVQPLMELWGFFGQRREVMPTEAEIQATLDAMGPGRVTLGRADDGRATLDVGGTALDLSAIAKGHAVDRVHNALSRAGVGSLFVEVGGEVRVSGPARDRPRWRVGVDLPDISAKPGQDLALVVSLTNRAVATSGNYRNLYKVEDQVVAHTMDPRVGRPVQTQVASATVIAPNCRTADGWATALMVLPPDEGIALLERLPDIDAAVLLVQGNAFELRATSGIGESVDIVSDRVSFETPTR